MQLSQFLKIVSKKLKFYDFRKKKVEVNQEKIDSLAKTLIKKLKKKKLYLAIMESCTGGGLANAITNIPGASEIFKGGFVVYSNQEKIARGVPKKLIKKYSVYSPEVALAMAYQAIKEIRGSDIGLGITGSFSRPDPRNPNSFPGQIFIAVIYKNKFLIECFLLPDLKNRKIMKAMAIYQTMRIIKDVLK